MRIKILVTFLSRFGGAVAGFVIAILLSRFLGAEGKGQASLLILNISFINLLTGVMGGSSMVFLAPRFPAFSLLFISYIWVPCAALLLWCIYYLSGYTFVSLDANTFVLATILGWFQANANFLLGKKQTHTYNILTLLQVFLTLAYLFAAFYLPAIQHNFNQYIWALYTGYGISFLASCYYTYKEVDGFKLAPLNPVFRQFFKHGGYMQLANLAQLLIYRTSYYIIDYYHNLDRLGIYSNAIALAESIWIVSRSVSTILYAEAVNEASVYVSSQKMLRLRKINLGIATLLTLIICFLPDRLYTAIFGKDFAGLQQIIWYLSPGILAYAYTIITTHFFAGIGKNYYNTIISFTGFGLTIAIGLVLIPAYNTTGAALTASIAYTLNAIQAQVMYKRLEKFI